MRQAFHSLHSARSLGSKLPILSLTRQNYSSDPENKNDKVPQAPADKCAAPSVTDTEGAEVIQARTFPDGSMDMLPVSLDAWCKRHKQQHFTDGVRQLYVALGHAAQTVQGHGCIHKTKSAERKMRTRVHMAGRIQARAHSLFPASLLEAVRQSNLQLASASDYIDRVEAIDFLYRERKSTGKNSIPSETKMNASLRARLHDLSEKATDGKREVHTLLSSATNFLKSALARIPFLRRQRSVALFIASKSPVSQNAAKRNDGWNVITLSDVNDGLFDRAGLRESTQASKKPPKTNIDIKIRCRLTVVPNPQRFFSNFDWLYSNIRIMGASSSEKNASAENPPLSASLLHHYRNLAATYIASNNFFSKFIRLMPKPITLDASMLIRQNTFLAQRFASLTKDGEESPFDATFADILPCKMTYVDITLAPEPKRLRFGVRKQSAQVKPVARNAALFHRQKRIQYAIRTNGRFCRVVHRLYARMDQYAAHVVKGAFAHRQSQRSLPFRIKSMWNDRVNGYPLWVLMEKKAKR